MAPSESTALTELIGEVRDLRADLRVFQTKLMGDDQTEDAQGRIPRIEATLADHEKRIKRGERLGWAAHGAAVEWRAAARQRRHSNCGIAKRRDLWLHAADANHFLLAFR